MMAGGHQATADVAGCAGNQAKSGFSAFTLENWKPLAEWIDYRHRFINSYKSYQCSRLTKMGLPIELRKGNSQTNTLVSFLQQRTHF